MNWMSPRLLGAVCAAVLAVACAQRNGDINRVQPNHVRKTDLLDGQWYIRNTVTGASANTGFTFTGETGSLEKVVWDVQEGYLVGYRAYPHILGTDDAELTQKSHPSGTTRKVCIKGVCAGESPYYGAPLVRFRIQSHFDIQRTYDTTTGEQGNVITENTSDRPWNEREYIRVDWSQSETDKGAGLMWGSFGNAAGGSSLSSWIQEKEPGTDPYDWPTAEYTKDAEGNERLVYMDFTSRHYAKPDEVEFPGYGTVPVCYLLGGERYDCTSQEIKVRTSIARVDPSETLDYEPLVYDNAMMAKFGYFRTERLAYDRKYGYTEAKRLLLANRYDLWEHTYDRGADGTSPIEVDEQGRVTNRKLAPSERTPKAIVYYLPPKGRMGSEEVYAQYVQAARELAEGKEWRLEHVAPERQESEHALTRSWDLAFRRAVAAAQGRANLTPEQLKAQVPQMLYVCETPVPQGAPEACGEPGFLPRFGDLRYSFLYTITEPTPNGLLGYGPSSADPETGEILSANANIYTGAVDSSAQYTLDVIDLVTGEVSIVDHISGKAARDYMRRNSSYAEAFDRPAGPIQSAQQGLTQSGAATVPVFQRTTGRAADLMSQLRGGGGLPLSRGSTLAAAAEKLRAYPALESAVVDGVEASRDVLQLLPESLALKAQGDAGMLREAARMVTLTPDQVAAYQKRRIDEASRHNLYLAEFLYDPLVRLATRLTELRNTLSAEYESQGSSSADARRLATEELRRMLQKAIWRATAEHEIGHTFGLRHNFAGTFDAVNYFDEYWEHRKKSLTVVDGTGDRVPVTPADLRSTSIGTEEQLLAGMHDYEYSSIMDYASAINADFQGVGRYDAAAILFVYSGDTRPGYVEVFSQARIADAAFPASDGSTLTLRGAAKDLPLVNAQHVNTAVPHFNERFHYSTVPLRFGEGGSLKATIDSGIARLRERALVKWQDLAPKYTEVRTRLSANGNPLTAPDVSDLGVPLEVPYQFCTDDHVGYVLSCNRFDRGPDYFEMTRSWLEDYWNSYYFTHFARDRHGYNPAGALYKAYGTFTSTGMVYKHLLHALYQGHNATQQTFANYSVGPLGYDPLMQATWTMGALDGINDLFRVMQMPPAGFFALMPADINGDGFITDVEGDGLPEELQWTVLFEGDEFDALSMDGMAKYADTVCPPFSCAFHYSPISRGDGRRMYSSYDVQSGYGFEYRISEAGHYNDQMGAMFASVTEPFQMFLGGDDVADVRRYALPYSLLFKDEMEQTFGALWSGDEAQLRPSIAAPHIPDNRELYKLIQAPVEWQTKVHGEKYFEGFTYPLPPEPLPADWVRRPVDIQSTWTSRIYALYLGMAGFSINFDFDYARQNQVFKVGTAEAPVMAPGYRLEEVRDVTTGVTYGAFQKIDAGNQDVGPRTPAVRMIKYAKDLLAVVEDPRAFDPTLTDAEVAAISAEYTVYFRQAITELDVMRGFYNVFGKAF
ncbi:MAG: hypothetical protein L0Y64_06995 [Myxococcaceae bacterium]|nr:hypothetical protein [Myxococcaceae bacterium]